MLRDGYISHINGTTTTNIQELTSKIATACQNKDTSARIRFGAIRQHVVHPILGVPQLQHDQLNIMSKHISEIKEGINDQQATNGTDNITSIIHKLTSKNLKLANSWYTWK